MSSRIVILAAALFVLVSAQMDSSMNGTSSNNGTSLNNGTSINGTSLNNGTSMNGTSSNNGTSMNGTMASNKTMSSNSTANMTSSPEWCNGLPDGQYAFKNSSGQEMCEKYLLCVGGMGHLLLCPVGQVFSVDKNQCMVKGLVDQPCGSKAVTAPIAPSCVGKKEGDVLKDINSCRHYWLCSANGTAVRQNCSMATAFSEANKTCIDISLVEGCLPIKDLTLAGFCQQQNKSGLFADPSTCNRGIICLNNTHFAYTCVGWAANWPTNETGTIGRLFFSNSTLECVNELTEKCLPKPLPLTTTIAPANNTISSNSSSSANQTVTSPRGRRHVQLQYL